jgi:hypothetical protein
LDGDALRIWNTGSSRGVIEYVAPEPFTSGVEFSMDAIIESDESGQYLWRFGAEGGNLAALGDSAVEIRFNSGGDVRVRVDGGQNFEDANVGLDTPFSVAVLINPVEAGGSSLAYEKNGITGSLPPQQFAVFVDGSLLDTYPFQNPSSNIGGFFLGTGTGANQPVPTMQLDNLSIQTGEDISSGDDPIDYGTYGGYPVVDEFYVDTGAWLGFLYIGDAPWIWSYKLNSWIYMEEPGADAPGAWVYLN